MALTRAELDPMRCGEPGCTCASPLFLHARCHPESATWAVYDRETGHLAIVCAECSKVVTSIEVARG